MQARLAHCGACVRAGGGSRAGHVHDLLSPAFGNLQGRAGQGSRSGAATCGSARSPQLHALR